jgi:hypothetical protein
MSYSKLYNTKAQLQGVDPFALIPGRIYLIQNKFENTIMLDKQFYGVTESQKNNYNTRFKGKFVRYDDGYSATNPNGILGITVFDYDLMRVSGVHVAIFEDVELISKNKGRITEDVWILSLDPSDGKIHGNNLYKYGATIPELDAVQKMLQDMRNNTQIAFDVRGWDFSETIEMKRTLDSLANDDLNSNDTAEQQRSKKLRTDVLGEGLMGSIVSGYAGTEFPKPSEERITARRTIYKQRNTSGDESKMDVEGGRKRSRKNRRGKTRKCKSRKGKTRRGRRHYKK